MSGDNKTNAELVDIVRDVLREAKHSVSLWKRLADGHEALTQLEQRTKELESRALPEWQPIDTAPKDGTKIILGCIPPKIEGMKLKTLVLIGFWGNISSCTLFWLQSYSPDNT